MRLCAAILFLLVSVSAWAQEPGEETGFVIDKIVAKVDNYVVLKSEVDKAYLDYVTNQGGRGGDEIKCEFLAILIRNKLMLAKAEIDSVVVSDEEVDANTDRRISIIVSQYGGSEQDLEKRSGKRWSKSKRRFAI